MDNEIFPVVRPDGSIIGKATRKECHSGSMLLHPVVHLHVMREDGTLYLQKRALTKDIQPGKWDTSVGGHVDYGETIEAALHREAREELGLCGFEATALPPYVFCSDRERELINPFIVKVNKEIVLDPDPVEICEGRFWSVAEIENKIGHGIFTPNFEKEFIVIRKYLD